MIGPEAIIGEKCVIYQGVTIGKKGFDVGGYPIIGNNVIIYANAVIVGQINVGDNCIIGAGSVVVKDVPANCCVVGNPAKILKKFKK